MVIAFNKEKADVHFPGAYTELTYELCTVKGAVIRKPRQVLFVFKAAFEFLRSFGRIYRGFEFRNHLPGKGQGGGNLMGRQLAECISSPGGGAGARLHGFVCACGAGCGNAL